MKTVIGEGKQVEVKVKKRKILSLNSISSYLSASTLTLTCERSEHYV